ncbi:hypothetical protein EC957_006402 [Mortierella hygrophila]|uniref:Uncharacterized protein n=1 Tax=Mortierella hygrophila TaxID=979708 RepID=A0A9P6EZI5_9FUNG|nr:hypothetical protein EC957_006402 [Mortierella hygrophila]
MAVENNNQLALVSQNLQEQTSVLHSLDQLQLNDRLSPPPSPAPPTRARWYYEKDVENSSEYESTYHTIGRRKVPPMTVNTRSKYIRWNIPVPQSESTYLDVVLGVKARDLQYKSIEAVIVTVEQFIGTRTYSRCEVITPQELRRLCWSTTTPFASVSQDPDLDSDEDADLGIMKWKIKEQLLQSEGAFHVAIEVKTWEGASRDFGTIEVHFVETHSNARRYYLHDPMYIEHQPYVFSIDVNNTGCPSIDRLAEKPNFVDSYVFSKEGAHLAIDVLSKSGRFVILWQINELPASDPRCIHRPGNPNHNGQDNGEAGVSFCPIVVAWMYFSKSKAEPSSVDLALSFDGTQVAVLDKIRPTVGRPEGQEDEDKEAHERCTAVYRFSPESIDIGDFPPDANAGSGFVRVNVAETCPNFADFEGRAEFHVVAAKDPDVKDELLVACDGVTVEIYSVYGVWRHVRTIVLDPTKDSWTFRRNVFAALFKQLRGRHLVLLNAQSSKVSTWDIETGEQVSSSNRFGALEMWALSHVANVSRDGMLITIPGKEHLGVFETTTWKVVGWFKFPGVGRREYVGEGLFIRNDKQVMVSIESDEQPLYRRNRGYIINLETMKVADEYVSPGTDIFRALPTRDGGEEQVILGVGNSSAYGFRVEDRVLLAAVSGEDEDEDHDL